MNTIKNSKEIDYIYKNGKRFNFPFLTLIILNNNNHQIKGDVAFIAGKRWGNAVWRNQSKRILREIYNKLRWNNKVLLIAKKNINNYKQQDMVSQIQDKLKEYEK